MNKLKLLLAAFLLFLTVSAFSCSHTCNVTVPYYHCWYMATYTDPDGHSQTAFFWIGFDSVYQIDNCSSVQSLINIGDCGWLG